MKNLILRIIFVAVLLTGANVHAEDSGSVSAGITPTNNLLYGIDILSEDIWQNFLGIFGGLSRQAQLKYVEKRIKERESEVWEMVSTRGALSDEAEKILDHKKDHRLKATEIALEDEDYEKIKEIQDNGWRFDFDYAKYVVKVLDENESNKNELLDEIAAARKAGDNEKIKDLALQMNSVRQHEDDLLDRNRKFVENSEMASERIENIVPPERKIDLLFLRIAQEEKLRQEKKVASDALWKRLLKDLDRAKKEVAKGLEISEIEDLIKDLQKLLRDIRAEEEKKVEEKLVKDDEEIEELIAPKEKAVLKKIPSETISKFPLGLMGWNYMFQATVNEYFETEFDGLGGLPPYYFKLDTASGFPPIGIILSPKGLFSGTPKVAGTYTFTVCVVDTAGKSDCLPNTMYVTGVTTQPAVVQPAPAPKPVPVPKIDVSISLTNKSCSVIQAYSDYTRYTRDVTGTASGPVGAKLKLTYTPLPVSCGSWKSVDVNSRGNACERGEGDPETTNWSFHNPNTANTWTGDTLAVEFAGDWAKTDEQKCP